MVFTKHQQITTKSKEAARNTNKQQNTRVSLLTNELTGHKRLTHL